jgi:hypothetical protein
VSEKLKEMRIFHKSRWKEWKNRRKRSEEIKQKLVKNPSVAEVVSLTRNSRTKEQKSRAMVQEWMGNLKAEKQEQQAKHEKKRRRCREQLEGPERLELTVLSNKPMIEEFELNEFKRQVRPDYQSKEIIQEVR